LDHPYYEVRSTAVNYLAKSGKPADYQEIRESILKKFSTASIEEKLAYIRLIAKMGDLHELKFLNEYYLTSNSLIREEILEMLNVYYRRKLISKEELKEHLGNVLITSNNLNPEFKLKAIIRKIYKEIE